MNKQLQTVQKSKKIVKTAKVQEILVPPDTQHTINQIEHATKLLQGVEMNPNAKKWIAALESGRYKKCIGVLSNEDKFCVLGVATDLYLKEYPDKMWDINIDRGSTNLTEEVRAWLGLETCQGNYGDRRDLTELNDSGNFWSFKRLAKFIKKNYNKLFEK